jgi:superfamily I DNA/RNA helicase
MNTPSDEQLEVIHAPLAPMSVVACAGSGKTFTAVHRLARMRRELGNHRGRIALLSFSNVAVETFRKEYQELALSNAAGVSHHRVDIATLDGFITSNVLLPHAHRTMGAQQSAFLVTGGEAFLAGFTFRPGDYPRGIDKMQVGIDGNGVYFCYSDNDGMKRLNTGQATQLVHRLGRVGAYTHDLGRYWCHRTLAEQPNILRALARRYPHILIDEAQDIGTMHQAIIEQLIRAGSQVSLVGDPNQGIYEFAGANGALLTQYGAREGVNRLSLTKNYRSVPSVVDLANRLSARGDDADRKAPKNTHGAFFVPYRNAEVENLVDAFQAAISDAGLMLERSAVLCRGRDLAKRLSRNEDAPGQGTVKNLARAAILRDRHQDYFGAFKLVAGCIVGLLTDPPRGLVARITQSARYPEDSALRRLIWTYTRIPDTGLPAAALIADTEWHALLLERTRALLAQIAQHHGWAAANNLGGKLARTRLPHAPLLSAEDLAANSNVSRIRVDTVHQAKGESLDAVLYLANRQNIDALMAGINTEAGRIGYVAVTRARDLFWLGIPRNSLAEVRPALLGLGFREFDYGLR